jgi:hypothetical protein
MSRHDPGASFDCLAQGHVGVIDEFRVHVAAIVVGFAIIIASGVVGQAANLSWKLDDKHAQALAALAVGHGVRPEDLEPGEPISPPFFVFYGVSRPPVEGSFGPGSQPAISGPGRNGSGSRFRPIQVDG